MLEIGINQITINFGFEDVLDGASFEVMTGDRIGLVGRNGCGKSTILKMIAGLIKPNQGTVNIRSGAIIGYMEQIPSQTDVDTTVHDVLMEPFDALVDIERRMRRLEASMADAEGDELDKLMRSYAYQQSLFESSGGYEIEESLARICTGLELTDILMRPFSVLSGGQKTLVVLARTLLRQPDILLLDEPTNHLDMRMLRWFERYLSKYKGTVLIVSHDRYFLDAATTKTVLLRSGCCKLYHGNYSFSQQEAERELLVEFEQYKNQQKKIAAMKAAISRYREWANRSSNEDLYRKAKELERRLDKMEMLERPTMEKAKIPLGFSGRRTGKELIRLKEMPLSVGGLELLRGATFTLFYQDRVCLLGDNGSGKTTLIRKIMATARNEQGCVFVSSSAKIGYIEQEIRFADDKMSVFDAFKLEHPCPDGIARGLLAQYFFTGDKIMKRVSTLSGGEKVLLKLAILVQHEINLLILDEPTNHIDINTREILELALEDFKGTILFISHDRYFISKLATRVLVIEGKALHVYNEGLDLR